MNVFIKQEGYAMFLSSIVVINGLPSAKSPYLKGKVNTTFFLLIIIY